MHNKVNNARKTLRELYNAIKQVNDISVYRTSFITNPGLAIETVASVPGLNEEILAYKEIFKTDVNSLVAKDDAIDIINASLIASIDALAVIESTVVPAINEIIAVIVEVISTLTDERMSVIATSYTKANSSLPYKELFSKRLDRSLNAIMSKEGIASEEYLPWLYGIYKELTNDNISELLTTQDFQAVEKYLNTATPVSLMSQPNYTPIVDEYDGKSKYNIIANYIETPDSDISGLDTLIAIGTLLITGANTAETSGFGYVINNISTVSKYRDNIAKSLEDALVNDIIDVDALLVDINQVAHKLARVSDKVVYECTDVYYELRKRNAVFLLLIETTFSDNS